MNFIRKGLEAAKIMVVAIIMVFYVGMILEIIAPIVTIFAVLVGTIVTFKSWTTMTRSIGGLVLYVASWPVLSSWGYLPSMIVWSLGVLLWFSAVYEIFKAHFLTLEATTPDCHT
jgi:hypothetical protein